MFFQCPWLPEFMLTAQDVALFDGCFRSGPIAPRNRGAVSDDDIERFLLSSPSHLCHTALPHHDYLQADSIVLWDGASSVMLLMRHACLPYLHTGSGMLITKRAEVRPFIGRS